MWKAIGSFVWLALSVVMFVLSGGNASWLADE